MKKITNVLDVRILVPVFLILFLFSTGCIRTDQKPSAAVTEQNSFLTSLDHTVQDIDTIYTLDYQSDISDQITSLKEKKNYTPQNPLVIANPFGTNTTGLYIYFSTDVKSKASYTVSATNYKDFSANLNGDYTTQHEYLLVGIVPDTENTITLTLRDENGKKTDSLELTYHAPSLLGRKDNIQLSVTPGESSKELSNGLYTMLGNRTEEDNQQVDFILLYDNYGTIRSEIPIKSYRACNVLFENEQMYFSTSSGELAVMNQIGQITNIYHLGNYQLHHDYIFGSQNDILVLATKKNSDTQEDRILSIDKKNGKITEVIDLTDLFGDYLDTLDNPTQNNEAFDWMHINSIELVDENSIIISSRETSTIIRINNIYKTPTIRYLIGSSQFWKESGYDGLVLKQIGNFSLNAGQHCVTYETSDDLNDGQYYLSLFNNNNAICNTRNYDYDSDDGYNGTFSGSNGSHSYYDKYLIDENKGTFTLIERIPVTYSGYVSSVQTLGSNLLIDSGSAFTAVEFDTDSKAIQTLTGTGDTWWYRVFKYDYKGFWFE